MFGQAVYNKNNNNDNTESVENVEKYIINIIEAEPTKVSYDIYESICVALHSVVLSNSSNKSMNPDDIFEAGAKIVSDIFIAYHKSTKRYSVFSTIIDHWKKFTDKLHNIERINKIFMVDKIEKTELDCEEDNMLLTNSADEKTLNYLKESMTNHQANKFNNNSDDVYNMLLRVLESRKYQSVSIKVKLNDGVTLSYEV